MQGFYGNVPIADTEAVMVKVKIIDVAREAGVSKSTVSRVLNKDKAVSEQSRKAVNEAIKKLNYTPSYFAQGIRTRRTKTVAMLVPEYSNYFYSEMFLGAEDAALKHKYMVLVCSTLRHAKSEIGYIKELLSRSVDGIIYNTYRTSEDTLNYLNEISKSVPVVIMNPNSDENANFSYVYTDGFDSTRQAVHYLYEKGRHDIGYLKNLASINITDDRFQGYLMGMKDCGLPVEDSFIYQIDDEAEPDYIALGRKAAQKIIRSKKRPDALLAAIDMLAIGCIKEFNAHGIKVPDEINMIGFDNVSLCELIEPSLTTISQPTRLLGQRAVEIIIDKINGKAVDQRTVFNGKLIVRESTGC